MNLCNLRAVILPYFNSPIAGTARKYIGIVLVENDLINWHIVCLVVDVHVNTAVRGIAFINRSFLRPNKENIWLVRVKNYAGSTC